MEHFASEIKIQNFKSIKDIEINNCKRINLFIGKPNVGKSNILEAMSLFSLPYLGYIDYPNLKELVRIEEYSELFFNGVMYPITKVFINNDSVGFSPFKNELIINIQDHKSLISIEKKDLAIKLPEDSNIELISPYRNYFFPSRFKFGAILFFENYLSPPHGENLYDIIRSNEKLKNEFLTLFRTYGLHLVFDKSSQELKIMKGVENGEIFLIPFSSVADSLQRLIFYKTAIKSNENSIITFEEPEAHTYPPYIAQIARDIIDAKTNQFFITTHSPYVVNELLENTLEELAIYMVDFKDGQTVVRRLTDNELDEVYNDGIDLFFNNEFFL